MEFIIKLAGLFFISTALYWALCKFLGLGFAVLVVSNIPFSLAFLVCGIVAVMIGMKVF